MGKSRRDRRKNLSGGAGSRRTKMPKSVGVCKRTGKKKYKKHGHADRTLDSLRLRRGYEGASVYICKYCGTYHIGRISKNVIVDIRSRR